MRKYVVNSKANPFRALLALSFLAAGLAIPLAGMVLFAVINLGHPKVRAASFVKYTALGDSITQGYGVVASDNWVTKYNSFITQDLSSASTVDNLGIFGIGAIHVLNKLNTDNTFRSSVANADVITLEIGVNDWIYGRGTCLGSGRDSCFQGIVADFRSNFSATVAKIMELNNKPTTVIRMMDMYNPFVSGDTASGNFAFFENYLDQMNNIIYERGSTLGIPVAQVHDAFNGNLGTIDPIASGRIKPAPDGVHPTPNGHTVIANLFRALGYVPTAQVPTGSFNAQYFNNADFTNYVLSENVPKVILPSASPLPSGVDPASFSVIFRGKFNFMADKWRFNSNAVFDGGDKVKIFVDNNLVVDSSATVVAVGSGLVTLSAGLHDIRVEYSHQTGTRNLSVNFVKANACFDMDGNNTVNASDILVVSKHFGSGNSSYAAYDVSPAANGVVTINSADLLNMAQHFGRCTVGSFLP